ncbi:hypothetical protein HFD88_001088 [Aspergillus terreus]|nr:hypothetical protein HFD88_001088 [Aspergillus terreus]
MASTPTCFLLACTLCLVTIVQAMVQNCYGVDEFPGHGDVAQETQYTCAEDCLEYLGVMAPGIDPVTWTHEAKGALYHYVISWVEDCEGEPQDVVEPFEGTMCVDLLQNNWKDCINGGAGGWVDVGCVRYEFKPSE